MNSTSVTPTAIPIRLLKQSAAVVAAIALLVACDGTQSPQRYEVVIAGGGDIALDGEFLENLADAFTRSPLFSVASHSGKPDFVVVLQRNVHVLDADPRGLVGYEVAIRATNGETLEAQGECPKHELNECADQILTKSEDFARLIARRYQND